MQQLEAKLATARQANTSSSFWERLVKGYEAMVVPNVLRMHAEALGAYGNGFIDDSINTPSQLVSYYTGVHKGQAEQYTLAAYSVLDGMYGLYAGARWGLALWQAQRAHIKYKGDLLSLIKG